MDVFADEDDVLFTSELSVAGTFASSPDATAVPLRLLGLRSIDTPQSLFQTHAQNTGHQCWIRKSDVPAVPESERARVTAAEGPHAGSYVVLGSEDHAHGRQWRLDLQKVAA